MGARDMPVKFTRALGHATQRQVDRGLIAQIDKEGNNGAEALAEQGAEHHAAPRDLATATRWRKEAAKATRRMMLRILRATQAAEETLASVRMASRRATENWRLELMSSVGGCRAMLRRAAKRRSS